MYYVCYGLRTKGIALELLGKGGELAAESRFGFSVTFASSDELGVH